MSIKDKLIQLNDSSIGNGMSGLSGINIRDNDLNDKGYIRCN